MSISQIKSPWPAEAGMRLLGAVKHRSTHEIEGSNFSIGCETLDRDYASYEATRPYLAPLGIKKGRIQSGWNKTEKVKGQYEWDWMDAIIPDMIEQGVTPWVCLCYGNDNYGEGTNLGSNPPCEGEPLEAWLRYIEAFVRRYGHQVPEYELWNEPRCGHKEYTTFFIATAELIRKIQPDACIDGCSAFSVGTELIHPFLASLKEQGKLDLVDKVTYHPYSHNPDGSYSKVEKLKQIVEYYSPRIKIFQGENGKSSWNDCFGAMSRSPSSELLQAKWALRRLLGDLGRDIESSYFCMHNVHYKGEDLNGACHYGLLESNPDMSVHHPKYAYQALQNLTAIFDNRLECIEGGPLWYTRFRGHTGGDPYAPQPYSVFNYKDQEGRKLVVYWKHNGEHIEEIDPDPDATMEKELVLIDHAFEEPALVNMMTGGIYAFDDESWAKEGDTTVFTGILFYDFPYLIAERSMLPIDANREPVILEPVVKKTETKEADAGEDLSPEALENMSN
jgi:hypothetical protein